MRPSIEDVKNLAFQAGAIVRAGYGQNHSVTYKGAIDLVTEIDHQSEDFLVAAIRAKYPEHSIITEESGKLEGVKNQRWFLDPLDGTVNFSHDLPVFSVSVAYAEEGRVELGVVYDPIRDECFSAERSRGAWLNGNPIHVSATPDMQHALMATGFPYDMWENPDNNLDNFIRISKVTQGVRRLGSATLDLCYVASGRLDGYWEIRTKSWDIAAGGLIVEEAGGVVTKVNGDPQYMTWHYDVMASTPRLHPLLLSELNR
jgi:myo-inositol-1(or 4)-monophosphatase